MIFNYPIDVLKKYFFVYISVKVFKLEYIKIYRCSTRVWSLACGWLFILTHYCPTATIVNVAIVKIL